VASARRRDGQSRNAPPLRVSTHGARQTGVGPDARKTACARFPLAGALAPRAASGAMRKLAGARDSWSERDAPCRRARRRGRSSIPAVAYDATSTDQPRAVGEGHEPIGSAVQLCPPPWNAPGGLGCAVGASSKRATCGTRICLRGVGFFPLPRARIPTSSSRRCARRSRAGCFPRLSRGAEAGHTFWERWTAGNLSLRL